MVAGPRAELDQLAADAGAVFVMAPLWLENKDAAQDFKRWEVGRLHSSIANLAEAQARQIMANKILERAQSSHDAPSAAEAELVERSRHAHRSLSDLDELVLRCLDQPGPRDDTELSGLRAQRHAIATTLAAIRDQYVTLTGTVPDLWPV